MMLVHNNEALSREKLLEIVSDVERRIRRYPCTDLWWFGSSVNSPVCNFNDIDFAIIVRSADTIAKLKAELGELYPASHISHARIYTKSRALRDRNKLPLHFVFGQPSELLSNHRLLNGLSHGVRIG